MKKNLLLAFAGVFMFNISAYAQETKISFEAQEGFVLGAFDGQKGWGNWGYVDRDHSNVVNSIASDGVNSVHVISNEAQEGNWGGILYKAPQYNKISISADVYLDSRGASDYDMLTLYSSDIKPYERIGGFRFFYDDEIDIGNDDSGVTINWVQKKWYNLKVNVDFTAKKIDYFVDNVKVTTTTFNKSIRSILEFDFELDNEGSGFKVDNVKIQDLNKFAVDDVSQKSLKIYPNPVSDILNIESQEKIENITIFDVNAKVVLTAKSSNQLKLENLSAGIYLIKIKTKDREFTEKFIKK